MHPTPFISTTPLDVLAGTFFFMCILSCFLAFCIISVVVLNVFNIDVYIDTKGYNLLVLKAGACVRGYGIRFREGLQIWRYLDRGTLGKTEIRIFPTS